MSKIDLTTIIAVEGITFVKERLERTLESIALQTIKPREVIITSTPDLDKDLDFTNLVTTHKSVFDELDIHLTQFTLKGEYVDFKSYSVKTIVDEMAFPCYNTIYFNIIDQWFWFEPTWYERVVERIEIEDHRSVYLPITKIFNNEDFARFEGEIYYNISTYLQLGESARELELGAIVLELLKDYGELNSYGAVFHKEDYLSVGGVKTNIELFAFYELLLRLAYNKKKLFVLPKSLVNRIFIKPSMDVEKAKSIWEFILSTYQYNSEKEFVN
jgi:hypothetical protein